jgi:hypothetical protein
MAFESICAASRAESVLELPQITAETSAPITNVHELLKGNRLRRRLPDVIMCSRISVTVRPRPFHIVASGPQPFDSVNEKPLEGVPNFGTGIYKQPDIRSDLH